MARRAEAPAASLVSPRPSFRAPQPATAAAAAGLDHRLHRARLLGHRPFAAPSVVQRLLVPRRETLFGKPSYDIGIGSPVTIVKTVDKPNGKVFYHRVQEHSADPAYDGRVYMYFPDTDRLASRTAPFVTIFEVEHFLLASGLSKEQVEVALDPAYDDRQVESLYIQLVETGDLEGLQRLVEPYLRRRDREPQGLPNRRFDCFLNAVTQIMAGPYAFVFAPGDPPVKLSKPKEEIRTAVRRLVREINNEDRVRITKLDIEDLRATLLEHKVVLSDSEQEDAAELMRKLLEAVLPADESVGLRLERTIDEKDSTDIEASALGSDPAAYQAGKRTQAESSNMIEVEMDRYSSLHAFLYEQFGKGVVTEFDAKNRPKVRSGEKAVEVSKVTERRAFTRLPNAISFLLKRFRILPTGGRERIGKQFDMPKELFLADESGAEKSYVEYELAGVVVQTGALSSGHYYSHVKRGDQWRKLDDDKPLQKDSVDRDLDRGYVYTFRRVKSHSALPKGAEAFQETAARPEEIDLNAELSQFAGVLDSGADGTGTKSDQIQGLPNRRDDCFLNAVLQLMAGPYASLFDPETNEVAPARQALQARLWGLMQRINKKEKGGITSEEIGALRKAMAGAKLTEGESGQEDAADVVRLLLAAFQRADDQAQIETTRTFEAKDATLIRHRDLPRDPAQYRDRKSKSTLATGVIPVELGGFNSLEGFLYHHYGVGETIDYDKKNRPRVRGDRDHAYELSKVEQRRVFKQLPELLTFSLLRFRIGADGGQVRIDRGFAMPQKLLLLEQPDEATKERVEFELVAVVVQRGGLEAGHYYTHRRDETSGKWLRADDESVTESDSPGRDLNQGYLYTYRRLAKASKGLPAAQESKELFAGDNLGKRLVYLVKTERFDEARELLSFPALDVNVPLKDGETALYLAIESRQPDLVARLLERGADPTLRGPLGTSVELATALDSDPKIKLALQLYSSSDWGTQLGSLRGRKLGAKKGERLDTEAMLQIFSKLETLEGLIRAQISAIADPRSASQKEMAELAKALEGVEEQRGVLNKFLVEFYEIQRAEAGGRPDVAKALEVPRVAKNDLSLLQAYVKQAKPASDRRTPDEFLASKGKTEREKLVQEALTVLFATRQGVFGAIKPGTYKKDIGLDIDLQADGQPWDQKAIVFEKGQDDFAGRLKETHHKYNDKKVGSRFDASVRPSERPRAKEAYTKVGLLFDSTYVLSQQYELAWQRIFELVLRGELDPRYIRETKAPGTVELASERHFKTTDRAKPLWALSVLAAEAIATPGSPRSTIDSTALPSSLQAHLLAIAQGKEPPIDRHKNDRGWLPGGVLYFEYSTSSGSDAKNLGGSHCKLVISHDLRHIYLSCSHYKGFTYEDGTKLVTRPAFYEIVPAGPLAAALPKKSG